MAHLPCPQWDNPEPTEKLDSVARAAVAIYEFILRQNPKKYLLGHGDLKTWHGKLFKDVVPVRYYAGNYRSEDPRYPCLNVNVQVPSGATGAGFQEVPGRMERFSEALIAATQDTDKYLAMQKSDLLRVKAAVQIAAFSAGNIIQIHPFLNGNGRIARLSANFFLNRYGLRMPFYIDRPGGLDYVAVTHTAMVGNFGPLANYILTLLAT